MGREQIVLLAVRCDSVGRLAFSVFALLPLMWICSSSTAATLAIATKDDDSEASTVVPILLTSPENEVASALQFDISLGSGGVQSLDSLSIVTGSAARSVEKNVIHSRIAEDIVRVIVAGFNQKGIPDGEVARIEGPIGLKIRLKDVLISDPFGRRIPVHVDRTVPAGVKDLQTERLLEQSGADSLRLGVIVVCLLMTLCLVLLGAKAVRKGTIHNG